MFQLFLRARAHKLLEGFGGAQFRARSVARDAETDHARVGSVVAAMESAIQAAEREQAGLTARMQDVLARASVTVGTATDEYLDREPHRSRHQDLFDVELANGQRRIGELAQLIGHLKFLRAATLSRFSDHVPLGGLRG